MAQKGAQTVMSQTTSPKLAVDAMGGDEGPVAVIEGVAIALKRGLKADIVFYGDQEQLQPLIEARQVLHNAVIVHTAKAVSMDDKPAQILRRGRDTSMWAAIEAVKNGTANAVVSCGNTGALMAVSYKQLGMIDGVDRPAISALWPTPKGRSVVLDVGATVEVTSEQLVQFAIMGEAFYRALTGTQKPTVALLNVGAEEKKGHDLVRNAARIIRKADPEMTFEGFVEGNDISKGDINVVVTDGFSGNVAIKSAEGAARLVATWLKEALKSSLLSKLGALLLIPALKQLKSKMDPSSSNGGVFLGLNGTVVKSHGGANAEGIATAIDMAANLARHPFQGQVAQTVQNVRERISDGNLSKEAAPKETAASNKQTPKQESNIKAVG